MFTVVISEKGGAARQVTFDKPEVTIGRVQGNDIILPKGNVSKRHARVVLKDGRFIVVDLKSTNGTYVNGRKITSPLVVKSGDKIYVGDFALTLEQSVLSVGGEPMMPEPEESLAPPAPPPLPAMGAPEPFGTKPAEGAQLLGGDGHVPESSLSVSGSESVPSSRFPLEQEPPASRDESAKPPPPLPAFPGVESEAGDAALGGAVADMDALPPVSNPPPLPAPAPFLPPNPPRVAAPTPSYVPPPAPTMVSPTGASEPPSFPGTASSPSSPSSPAAPLGGTGPIVQGGFGKAPGSSPGAFLTPSTVSASALGLPNAPGTGVSGPGTHGFGGSAGAVSPVAPTGPRPVVTPPASKTASEGTGASRITGSSSSGTAAKAQALNLQTTTGMRGSRLAIQTLLAHVAARFDVADTSAGGLHDAERRQRAEAVVQAAAEELTAAGELGGVNVEMIQEAVLREAIGLGALEPLLAESTVREVVVEGPGHVLADHGAGLKPTGLVFSSPSQLTVVALRLIAQAGGEVSANDPMTRVTLPYGPQVTVVLPPVAVRGPVIEIRRMAQNISADDLVDMGMLSTDMLELLRTAVLARRNIVVVGPSGSGVTTVVGAVAGFIDNSQRIVTVEEVPDLPIDRDHVVSLAAGHRIGGPRLGEVVRHAAKLRADRLVVDDVRGGELYDVFQVLSARRPGNLVGVHAETEQALSHLPALVRRGSSLTQEDATHLTAQVVHILVALDVDAEGKGRVSRIIETTMQAGDPAVRTLWAFEDGKFTAKGAPSFSG